MVVLPETELNDIIVQIPGWAGAQDLAVEQLEGLTNQNYSVTVNGERLWCALAARTPSISHPMRTRKPGLVVVSQAGLGPQVVRFFPEGHLVKRYIEGRTGRQKSIEHPRTCDAS